MNANAEKWLAALESGEYSQTTARLRDDEGFCCLGVGCEVAAQNGVPVMAKRLDPADDDERGSWTYDGDVVVTPISVAKWLGLRTQTGEYRDANGISYCLSADNDRGVPFTEIAQTIRTHPELFVDGER